MTRAAARSLVMCVVASALTGCAKQLPHLSPVDRRAESEQRSLVRNLSEGDQQALLKGGLLILNSDSSHVIVPGAHPDVAYEGFVERGSPAPKHCIYVHVEGSGIRPTSLSCAQLQYSLNLRNQLRQKFTELESGLTKLEAELKKVAESGALTAAVAAVNNAQLREFEKAFPATNALISSLSELMNSQNALMGQYNKEHASSMVQLQEILSELKGRLDALR